MSDYRSLVRAGLHPGTDPRRAAALRDYLRAVARCLTPGWAPTGEADDFGSALLEIAARLAEETTRRLDQSARRDAVAFLDFLGLPTAPPRAAVGQLVLALAEQNLSPVAAPARLPLEATGPAGDGVAFETNQALRIVPGRLGQVLVADPATDRIEVAPATITALAAPPLGPASYDVLTFADVGSVTLQLSPTAGLAPGALLRVGTPAYRIASLDSGSGMVTLEDPLEAPALAGSTVTRISALESFDLRNLQTHTLYLGHAGLFDLAQPAELSVVLQPQQLALDLTRLDVEFSLYGTNTGDSAPDWHLLDLLGRSGSTLRLAKTATGSVDKLAIAGHKSRWLRARLRQPVLGRPSATAAASRVGLGVGSLAGGDPAPAEGSRTVTRALHNGTPLATTRRFYPFGAEPLRFDVFALSAPEALSKPAAEVSLKVTMVDSSLGSLEIATGAASQAGAGMLGRPAGYGAGRNGDLEVLVFGDDLRWYAFPATAGDGRPVLLANVTAVGLALVGDGADLVVAQDGDGGLWTSRLTWALEAERPSMAVGSWSPLPALPAPAASGDAPAPAPNGRPAGPVLAPLPTGVPGRCAMVLAVRDGALLSLAIDASGTPEAGGWLPVHSSTGPGPALSGTWQLTPVQGPEWPKRPAGTALELVALDQDGVWVASAPPPDPAGTLSLAWQRLDHTGQGASYAAALDVGPAATRFPGAAGSTDLWVAYALPSGVGDRALHGVVLVDGQSPVHVPVGAHGRAPVAAGSTLHATPAVLGVDRRPVTAGLGSGSAGASALVWLGAEEVAVTTLPAAPSIARPVLMTAGSDQHLEVIVAGAGERVFRAAVKLPDLITFDLHDLVEVRSAQVAHWAEITSDPSDPAASVLLDLNSANRRIMDGDLRVYSVDLPAGAAGRTISFLRRDRPQGPAFPGSFDNAADRSALTLDQRDRATTTGHRLVIDSAGYSVTAVSTVSGNRVAQLGAAVLGSDPAPDYWPTTKVQADSTVEESDYRTLAEIKTATVDDTELSFGLGSDPDPQTLLAQEASGGSVWVRLGTAWTTPPPDSGQIAVPDSLTLPTWTITSFPHGYQNPDLSWEYYDGTGWRRLTDGFLDGTMNLSASGDIRFAVPADLTTTEIGGKEDYWIRARLVGGDYGRPTYVVTSTTTTGGTQQTVSVDTSNLHAPEILALEAAFSLPDPVAPEVVLVENNLDVVDQTQAATSAAARFEVFEGVLALDTRTPARAMYLGLTAVVPAGSVVLLVDAVDQEGAGPLLVDAWTAAGWHPVVVDDETASLRRRGLVTLSLDVDLDQFRLFGQERAWLRLRPGPDLTDATGADPAAGWAPVVRALYLNAVPVDQARTIQNEILGSSSGEPGLTLTLANQPVLPATLAIRVREELTDEELSALGSGDGEPPVLTDVPLVPGTWVLWHRVDSLRGQDGDARVFVLAPETGLVTFGDNQHGRIPPAGRDGVRAFSYQQGGGAQGNLPAWSAVRLRSALEGVQTAVLPIDTAGGFGGPATTADADLAADAFLASAPEAVRHAGRALTPSDVEALVLTSSSDIVRVRCARPDGPGAPLRVTIAVRGTARCPVPSLAQRGAVSDFLLGIGWGGLTADTVEVAGPDFVAAAVTVRLTAARERLADVEQAARERLIGLLDPVGAGPDGAGWPFGQPVTTTDVLRQLNLVDGLARVESVEVAALGGRSLNSFPADGLVYAQPADVDVVVRVEESG